MAIDKNLEKLNKLLSVMDEDSLTKEDFLSSFKKVIDFVQELKKENTQYILSLVDLVKKLKEDVQKSNEEEISKTTLKLEKTINKLTDSAKKDLEKMFEEQRNTLNFIKDKVSEIQNGRDADEDLVIERVIDTLSKMPKEKEDPIQLTIEDVEGLQEKLEKISKIKSQNVGGVVGRDFFQDIDISSQLNGSTKTFNIPAVYNIISVHLSSFPNALRKTVDFTYTPTSITFTDEIDASTTLASGQTCVLTVVTA